MKVAESIGLAKEAIFTARYYHGDMLHYLYAAKNDLHEAR